MRHIKLTGKYAVGDNKYAVVDDDLYVELNKYKWKAKPNGSGTHVYACRNVKVDDKCKLLRMHRYVLGVEYDGIHDIDHINRNTLDNRRENLRLCTRRENVLNSDYDHAANLREWKSHNKIEPKYLCKPHTCEVRTGKCAECGSAFVDRTGHRKYCSDTCKRNSNSKKNRKSCYRIKCVECGTEVDNSSGKRKYCSSGCRNKSWNRKRRKK